MQDDAREPRYDTPLRQPEEHNNRGKHCMVRMGETEHPGPRHSVGVVMGEGYGLGCFKGYGCWW